MDERAQTLFILMLGHKECYAYIQIDITRHNARKKLLNYADHHKSTVGPRGGYNSGYEQ